MRNAVVHSPEIVKAYRYGVKSELRRGQGSHIWAILSQVRIENKITLQFGLKIYG